MHAKLNGPSRDINYRVWRSIPAKSSDHGIMVQTDTTNKKQEKENKKGFILIPSVVHN